MEEITLEFETMSNNDPVNLIIETIPSEFFENKDELKFNFYSSISEIVANIRDHAYPGNFKVFNKNFCEALIRYDEYNLIITIIDHGASIPVTILNKISSTNLTDDKLLEKAASGKYSKNGRGIGLQDLMRQVRINTFNNVIISSGYGFLKECSVPEHSELKLVKSKTLGTNITLTKEYLDKKILLNDSFEIIMSKDFSEQPFGRYETDSPFSAEAFRENHVIPALNKYKMVTIDLTGKFGLASSFLEEVFGGLVRRGFSASELEGRLNVILPKIPSVVHQVWIYINKAGGRND
ncbi:TPA: STAS-like domain-containing protein [Citrobacter freundii]|nr:STAS-like domain-containing protein [Citrobacter freundii]